MIRIAAAPAETRRAPELSPALAELDRLGDEIARLSAHLHAATYRLLVRIGEFDRRFQEAGGGLGFRTTAHWLSWRTGVGPGAAREKVRVARALEGLPRIGAAMERGELSYSKVRAMSRVATAENEAELLELARHAPASRLERLVRAWRRVDRLEEAGAEGARHRSRYLRLRPEADGSFALRGRLDPEVGALLAKALEWAGEALDRDRRSEGGARAGGGEESGRRDGDGEAAASAPEEEPTAEQRRADALGLVAERALAAAGSGDGAPPVGRAERFQVVVHVDWETLRQAPASGDETSRRPADFSAETSGAGADREDRTPRIRWDRRRDRRSALAETGVRVARETSRRLACDAGVVAMTHAPDGRLLDVGRKRRSVPAAIRRALDERDRGCRFPGCGLRYTDAHHVVHWAEGGETKLDNLVLLCRRHHRAVHEEGFRVESPGGGDSGRARFRFHRPDGRLLPEVPAPPPVPPEPVTALMREHRRRGIVPDPWTATPRWLGEPLDYGLALDGLRRPASPDLSRP